MKVDFYIGPRYICSSWRYRNLKSAMQGFLKNPVYQGMREDGTIGPVRVPEEELWVLEVRRAPTFRT